MSTYELRLTRDRLGPQGRYVSALPAMNRILYVLDGGLTVEAGGKPARDWHDPHQYTLAFGRCLEQTSGYDLIDFTVFAGEQP